MPATAADIPIELYDLILDFLAAELDSWYDTQQDLRNKVAVSNRALAQVSLVCSLWARACQKKIFELIVLRTAADYQDILSLAAHETSRISQYIETFALRPQEHMKPWLHTLCLQMRARNKATKSPGSPYPNYAGHTLILFGHNAWNMTKKGLHTSLPRRVPTCFSRGITMLILANVTLHSLEDVIFAARRLPSLENLTLEQVTWEVSPHYESYGTSFADFLPAWSRPSRSVSLDSYITTTVKESSDYNQWVAFVVTCVLSSHVGNLISLDDYILAMWLVRTWITALQEVDVPEYNTATGLDDRTALGFIILRPGHLAIHTLWFVLSRIESDPPVDNRRIEYVVLETLVGDPDPDCIFAVQHLFAFNWAYFDQCIASMSALRGVIIGCASRKGVALTKKVVEKHIPQLTASGKLKYAVRQGVYESSAYWEEYVPDANIEPSAGRKVPVKIKADEIWRLCRLFVQEETES